MSVCFAAGAVIKMLQVTAFTLVWTHSVQKTDWQEDWRVTPDGLLLVEARIKGSGAGIDPPADARLIDGWWRWRPPEIARSEVLLARSDAAGDWRICTAGRCRTLGVILGASPAVGAVAMRPCSPDR
jgi:hypothetical protein